MFSNKDEGKLVKKYNEYYDRYFESSISQKHSNVYKSLYKQLRDRIDNSEYMKYSYKQICSNIRREYEKLSIEELYYNKKRIKSSIDSSTNKSSNIVSILVVLTGFIFLCIFLTQTYMFEVQYYHTNNNIVMNTNNKIKENQDKIKIIDYDIKNETDKIAKGRLQLEKQNILQKDRLLGEDNNNRRKNYNENLSIIEKNMYVNRKSILLGSIISYIVIAIIGFIIKIRSDNEYYYTRSFLLLCLDTLEDVEKNK